MADFTRLHLSRRQLDARLPPDGTAGLTAYRAPGSPAPLPSFGCESDVQGRMDELARASDTGAALFADGASATLVVPPFPFEVDRDAAHIDRAPLDELMERRRTLAVFLLRLGGFSVGMFRGDALIDSKTDQRFVKNRHRKGGQSQRRFERIREKQVDELFGKACETARATLGPYEREVEFALLGGDKLTLLAFRKQCRYFDERFGAKLLSRVLAVPGDPRRDKLEAMPREIWSSEVYVVTRAAEGTT